jgi:hypothetical protein
LKLPYLRASYTKAVGPIKFCIEIYLPRPLGDWAPFLRHPVCINKIQSESFFVPVSVVRRNQNKIIYL